MKTKSNNLSGFQPKTEHAHPLMRMRINGRGPENIETDATVSSYTGTERMDKKASVTGSCSNYLFSAEYTSAGIGHSDGLAVSVGGHLGVHDVNNDNVSRNLFSKGEMVGKLNPYWLCQLSGWCLWIAIVVTISTIGGSDLWISFLIIAPGVAFGFGSSHLYRRFIQKHNWTTLHLGRLIPRLIAASLLISVIWHMVDFSIQHYIWPHPLPYYSQYAYSIIYGFLWRFVVFLLWSLFYFGYHFFSSYRESEVEKLTLQSTLKDAELHALKAQINPHFFFNCLNSIRSLISESPEKAKNMITLLSNTLRYALQTSQKLTVSLEHELQVVSEYLALESIRLEDRLRVKLEVAPNTLQASVPPMILQTLVENAIKHGISKLPAGGEIRLSTRKDGNFLTIQVANDGDLKPRRSSPGVGLKNAISRLRVIYGESVHFTLTNSKKGVVTAQIRIPWEGGNNESHHCR